MNKEYNKTKKAILKKTMGKSYYGETYFDFLDEEEKPLIYKAMESYAEQERIKYALEVLKEVNLPYADNELLGRRVKNKINYLQKQMK